MERGKLIIIEAGDGCGKATQAALLEARLQAERLPVRKVEYPNYRSPSSALIKMYLNGDFGADPDAVNPFAASAFYAVDRYASYKTEWAEFYRQGGIVIADRYVTSNMVHQAVKIADDAKRREYLDWLWDFEFVKCGLPAPDCVIYLDVPPDCSEELLKGRASKSGLAAQDIHERNLEYLARCYYQARQLAQTYGWIRIDCVQAGRLRPAADIHQQVYHAVRAVLPTERF